MFINSKLKKMKPDIETREDIKLIVDTFYDKVKDDNQIGHFLLMTCK